MKKLMKETWVGLHANPAKPISNLDQANFQTRLGQYAIPARPTCHAGLAYLFCLKTQTKIQKGKIQSNKVQLSSKLTEMVLRMFRNYPGTSKSKNSWIKADWNAPLQDWAFLKNGENSQVRAREESTKTSWYICSSEVLARIQPAETL